MNETYQQILLPATVVDEFDYGLIVVDAQLRVGVANHAARSALAGLHALMIEAGALRAREPRSAAALRDAVFKAVREGIRCMLCLRLGAGEVSIAVTRLGDPHRGGAQALLLLQKQSVCGELAIQGFARSHGLTPTETAVLARLASGEQAKDIAARHAVEISTVRTQISAIRTKTNAANIGELLKRLALLPPMVPALR